MDGRHPVRISTTRRVILVTRSGCEEMGLFCPPDFAWRCGDYGFYLARHASPETSHFWLIEYDIRFGGGSASDIFRTFAGYPEVDFLATYQQPAQKGWHWYDHVNARNIRPHRCLFGIVRISARAADHLLATRRRHAKSALRRKLWPNDEGFTATTLAAGGYSCRDINDFGETYYGDDTISLTVPIRGETFSPPLDGVKIYHPVLFGQDFERGNTSNLNSGAPRLKPGFVERQRRRILRRFRAIRAW